VFHNHCQHRHVVNDNNNIRMQPVSIEETWKTSCWPHRVHAFILGVTVVNTQRAYENFGPHAKQSNLDFRRELVNEIIHNPGIPEVRRTVNPRRGAAKSKNKPIVSCRHWQENAHFTRRIRKISSLQNQNTTKGSMFVA
jgi:hypothetical protein